MRSGRWVQGEERWVGRGKWVWRGKVDDDKEREGRQGWRVFEEREVGSEGEEREAG